MKYKLGRKCNPIDILIGKKLQFLRKHYGISQKVLAEYVGITFQQIQKYEKGLNRISCSKLSEFANFFDVKPGVFFEQIPRFLAAEKNIHNYKQNDIEDNGLKLNDSEKNEKAKVNKQAKQEDNYLSISKESTILLEYFFKVKSSDDRRKIIELARTLFMQSNNDDSN